MSADSPPALASLLAPLLHGRVPVPATGRILFVQARAHADLAGFADRLVCEQTFKPHVDELHAHRLNARADADERFALVLMLPTRQRDQTRAALVSALTRLRADGVILFAAANNEGARSLQADGERLLGPLQVESLNKCRVLWSLPTQRAVDAELASVWTAAAAVVPVVGTELQSQPGVFSWDRVDPGSALLAEHLPADLAGVGADLGAGWGYLSAQLLRRCPHVTAIDLYEADASALALARGNLERTQQSLKIATACGYHWHDVAAGLAHRYDFVISNPPFHIGRADAPDLGRQFMRAAAASLRTGGRFWMVANRHLAYEAELRALFASVRKVVEGQGYKVFEAIR